MHFSLIALSVAAALPISSAHPVSDSTVDCREGPGANYSVVKTYNKGTDIEVTCQAADTGDKVWDKTSDGCYVTDYHEKTGTTKHVTKECGEGDGDNGEDHEEDSEKRDEGISVKAKLPGLTATQTKRAKKIIAEAKKEKLGRHGCEAGIATALVEVSLLIILS